MMQRLSRCRGHRAVHNKRTDAKALSSRRYERQDEYKEFDQYETDPCSSCQVQPESIQLYVRLWRSTRGCDNMRLLLLWYTIPEFYAFTPIARLLAPVKSREHSY